MNFVHKRLTKEEEQKLIDQYDINRTAIMDYCDVLIDEKTGTIFIGENSDHHTDPYRHGALLWKDTRTAVKYRLMHKIGHESSLVSSWFIESIRAPKSLEPVREELFNSVIDAVQAAILQPTRTKQVARVLSVFEYIAQPIFTETQGNHRV